ncbi:MAG: extracellular solute-binding protein [Alphaproteobacteria bacterium]|nr:extracellular solute-binding protein [Alphaproteobacteria bacterium]
MSGMTRRGMSAVAAAAIGLMVSAAPAQAQRTTINWWHSMSGQLGEWIEDVAKRYNASQDKYDLKPIFKGSYQESFNAVTAAYRAKEHPHLLQSNESSVITLMLSGVVEPAHEILERNKVVFDVADLVPPVALVYTDPKGKLIAMPFNSSTPILYYNADLIEKFGLGGPPKTWQEMEKQIEKMKAGGVPCGLALHGFIPHGQWIDVENYSARNDIPYASGQNGIEGLGVEMMFNKTSVVQHMERIKRWIDTKYAIYGSAAGAAAGGPRAEFGEGRCAFIVDSSALHAQFERDVKPKWGATFLPHEEGRPANNTVIGGAALFALKGHAPAVYAGIGDFFRFLSQKEIQIYNHQRTGYVPVTKSAYEQLVKDGYYNQKPAMGIAIRQLLLNAPTANSRAIRLGNHEGIRVVFTEEVERALIGQKSVQQAMDDAVRRANELLRRFEQQNRGKL